MKRGGELHAEVRAESRTWTDADRVTLTMERTDEGDGAIDLWISGGDGQESGTVCLPLHQVRDFVEELVRRGGWLRYPAPYAGCVDGDVLVETIITQCPAKWSPRKARRHAERVLAGAWMAGVTVVRGPDSARWSPSAGTPEPAQSRVDSARNMPANMPGDGAGNDIPAGFTSAPEDDPIGTVRRDPAWSTTVVKVESALRAIWRQVNYPGELSHAGVRDWPVIGAVPGTPAAEQLVAGLTERAESTVASVLIDHDWHPDAARAASDEDYRQHFARMARAAIDAYQEATLTPVAERQEAADARDGDAWVSAVGRAIAQALADGDRDVTIPSGAHLTYVADAAIGAYLRATAQRTASERDRLNAAECRLQDIRTTLGLPEVATSVEIATAVVGWRQHFRDMVNALTEQLEFNLDVDAAPGTVTANVCEVIGATARQRADAVAERRALREIADNLGLDVDTAPALISAAVLTAVTVRADQRQALHRIAAEIGLTDHQHHDTIAEAACAILRQAHQLQATLARFM